MADLINRTYRLAVDDLVITGLRLSFRIEKTLKPDPNVAEISVDNLTESQREAITAKKTPLVRLSVGYQKEETQIFYGSLVHVQHSFEGADIRTTLSTGDGIEEYRRKRVFASFGPKTSTAIVFQALLKNLGLKRGNADRFVTKLKTGLKAQIYLEGVSLAGSCAAELTALCKSANLEWSIQDGAYQILDKNESLNKFAIVLDGGARNRPNTGLIGSPSISNKGIVSGKSLIIPDMYPGRQVEIKSRFLSGRYRLDKVTYTGDTHGSDWYCDFEGRAKFGEQEIRTKFQDPSISALTRKVLRK
jgi:hypothetical protein